ncbi:hypothetical protein SAMN05444169_3842 [Bradyrhizobium erythrophlei]|uniref:Uncharacterized protein n=1 Tax=Bradyrhizobium erythrophlei TaxID=1437360 RepID=A0A1M5M5Y5_9BRAD|nr:hypothetical protein SAMN05444169_3842 [Bradyrhizobium erythrophlei]
MVLAGARLTRCRVRGKTFGIVVALGGGAHVGLFARCGAKGVARDFGVLGGSRFVACYCGPETRGVLGLDGLAGPYALMAELC